MERPFVVIILSTDQLSRCYRFEHEDTARMFASKLIKGEESFVFGPKDSGSIAHFIEL